MTVRLVALMSFVLLLSLAAVGLLIGHYQDSVLHEVEQTASQVGRAALSSLQSGRFPASSGSNARSNSDGNVAGDADGNEVVHWISEGNEWVEKPGGELQHASFLVVLTGGSDAIDKAATGDPGDIHTLDIAGAERLVTRTIRSEQGEGQMRIVEEYTAEIDCGDGVSPEDCIPAQLRRERIVPAGGRDEVREVYLRADAVHVERDPLLSQLILKIPRFQPTESSDLDAVGAPVRETRVLAKMDELAMPIPLQEYADLFDRLRSRSLWVFLCVFVLGTAVSAGIATRFTRPIRRLDAGIHRISAGDLDVAVDVEGKGEIARLGRAFNEMTAKLRSSRDRAREVVRQEKLSALGGLAAGVAHDVRNPLHSIGLTLQHLRETCRPEATDKAEEFDASMDILRGEVARLDQLVGNFLRFARSERKERQPVDLGDLLRETEQLIRKEAEWRGIDVVTRLNMAVPAIWADGEAIRSAVLNLVLNSFEAMPDGGTLRLELGVEGDHVRVQIADDGTGIEKDEQDKVFEFAYTTRETGSGLGLAMVHQTIVGEHGGRVRLSSEPGVGTQVDLHLPIRPPERDTEHRSTTEAGR